MPHEARGARVTFTAAMELRAKALERTGWQATDLEDAIDAAAWILNAPEVPDAAPEPPADLPAPTPAPRGDRVLAFCPVLINGGRGSCGLPLPCKKHPYA
jgi:hypothetical protein